VANISGIKSMLYSFKRALLKPYAWVQRKRHRHQSSMGIKILEVYSYSPTIKRFFRDSTNNPLLLDHTLDERSVVMDVGGYIGDWAEDIQQRYNPVIHVFEAHPGFIKKLTSKFSGVDKIIVHPYGLWHCNTIAQLSQKGPGSSLYPPSPAAKHNYPKPMEVVLRDINEVMEHSGLEQVELIKINIEGAEFPLLKRMLDTGLVARCNHIMVQYHEFAPKAHWQRFQINRALKRTHERVWNYPFIWEKWSRNSH